MNTKRIFEVRFPTMIKWSKNYTFLAPFIGFVYELDFLPKGDEYIQKIYDDLIKHNILSSNLEKELTNPNEEKRKLAKEIYNGLTDHLYSRVEKIT